MDYSIDQLIYILKNAPEDATHVSLEYGKTVYHKFHITLAQGNEHYAELRHLGDLALILKLKCELIQTGVYR